MPPAVTAAQARYARSVRASWKTALVVGAPLLTAGCVLVYDFDALEGPAAGGSDGGLDAAVAVDAPGPDAAPIEAGGAPCDAGPGLVTCTGFDDAAAPFGGWTVGPPSNGSSSLVTTTSSQSPPASLELKIPAASGSAADAFIERRFDDTGTHFAVQMSVFLEELPSGATGQLLIVGDQEQGGRVRVTATGSVIEESPGYTLRGTLGTPPLGRWLTLRMELDFGAGRGKVTLGGASTNFDIASALPPGSLLIRLGLKDVDTTAGAWTSRVDDLFVETL